MYECDPITSLNGKCTILQCSNIHMKQNKWNVINEPVSVLNIFTILYEDEDDDDGSGMEKHSNKRERNM